MTIYLYNALIYQILMSKFYFMSIVNVFIHAFIAMIIALSHLKKTHLFTKLDFGGIHIHTLVCCRLTI